MAFERFPYSNFHDLNLDWIIEQVQKWANEWDAVKKAYEEFDSDLTAVYNRLDQLDAVDRDLTTRLYNLTVHVNTIDTALAQLRSDLQAYEASNDLIVNDIDTRLSEIEENANWYMYSPFTGEYVPLATVIGELAAFHLENALTAEEYDALALNASVYDAKDLTAIQYDASGKILLP